VEHFSLEGEVATHKRPFAALAALIVLGGLIVMGAFTAFFAWGQTGTETPATAGGVNYNSAGSYGITGYPPLTVTPTSATPAFISDALNDNRGVILLAYVSGAAADDEMLASFRRLKSKYSAQASFFSFEARDVSELGDVLDQLRVSSPPALAVIRGDGGVYQLYTGWIGERVMDQVVANAVRI